MGASHITKHIIKFLSEHEGQTVLLPQLVTAIGASEDSIRGAILRAIKAGMPIEIVVRANAWRYVTEAVGAPTLAIVPEIVPEADPTPVPAPTVAIPRQRTPRGKLAPAEPLTIIGATRSGETIVQDGNGVLYTIKPM